MVFLDVWDGNEVEFDDDYFFIGVGFCLDGF